MTKDSSDLLDSKSMDGPKVKRTMADLFDINDMTFLTYHVASSGFNAVGTAGCILGGALYGSGLYRSPPSVWAAMGTFGLIGSVAGAALGLTKMASVASKGEAQTVPWTTDGIHQRTDGLRHNFIVRIMDQNAWLGLAVAAGALLYAGGPTKLKLSPGLLGVGQAMNLGTSLGVLGAAGCVWATRPPSDDTDDE